MKVPHRPAARRETRLAHAPVKLREAVAGEGPRRLEGYAAVFNVESGVLYDPDVLVDDEGNPLPFIEVLAPTVFTRTLVERPDVRALYNHDTSAVLGRTAAGTLRLWADGVGLAFSDDLPDTTPGRDATVSVGRGDIDGCSFGFCVVEDELLLRDGLPALRTLVDVDLYEISIAVAFPAYEATSTELRQARRTTRRDAAPPPTPTLTRPRLDRARRLLAFELQD